MLTFSTDPKVAERQMQAIIFYLTTFGYIDGDFDSAEKDFVREYIRKLVEVRVTSGMPQADETLRLELVGNFGQHEIGFIFDGVLRTCDNHTVYKNGAKEIAARHGKSLTFMAKYDQREGNSCHIHLSLRGLDGSIAFADKRRKGGQSKVFDQFLE